MGGARASPRAPRAPEEKTEGLGRVEGGISPGESPGPAGATASAPPWGQRGVIVGLCFFAFMLCNLDRVNLSIAILPMAEDMSWDPLTVGLVQSSFFWGYLLTQVLGGVLATKYGGKRVLGFGVLWWSLATCVTPLAAKVSLPALFVARAAMGAGEGVAMPAMNTLVSRWVPRQERSRSLSLVYSGMYAGSVLGLGLCPRIVQETGWPSAFFLFGSAGLLWFLIWQAWAASSPAESPHVSGAERAYILAGAAGAGARGGGTEMPETIPWREILSKKEVWAIIVSHFCHNWGTFILLTWMPSYYHDELGFDLMQSGLYSVLPWLGMIVVANAGGWLADTLIARGWSTTSVRRGMQTVGFMGPALCLSQLSSVNEPLEAVALMVVSQSLDAFSQSGLYSNHQDIAPRYSGVLLGMSNTAGVLAGVFGTAATGYILQEGSWDDVWGVAVGLYLVGTVVWNLFSTGEQIID